MMSKYRRVKIEGAFEVRHRQNRHGQAQLDRATLLGQMIALATRRFCRQGMDDDFDWNLFQANEYNEELDFYE